MDKARIYAQPNASYEVTGPVTLTDAKGKEVVVEAGKKVYLCRCGHSGNKPFCDLTHKKIGFKDA